MKLATIYEITTGGFLVTGIALLAYAGLISKQPVKEEPVKQESVTKRIMREYDLDGDIRTLNREELSNLLKDYQQRGEQ